MVAYISEPMEAIINVIFIIPVMHGPHNDNRYLEALNRHQEDEVEHILKHKFLKLKAKN